MIIEGGKDYEIMTMLHSALMKARRATAPVQCKFSIHCVELVSSLG